MRGGLRSFLHEIFLRLSRFNVRGLLIAHFVDLFWALKGRYHPTHAYHIKAGAVRVQRVLYG